MPKGLSKAFKRYLVIGGSVYLFELAVIEVALHFGQSSVVAIGLSFWLGLLVSFLLQKFVTFQDKNLHHRILLPQVLAFSLLVLFNFGFTILLAKLLSHRVPAVITRTLALGVTTLWNFYLYRTRIFANKPSDDNIY
jgi:putative flippase GtrA